MIVFGVVQEWIQIEKDQPAIADPEPLGTFSIIFWNILFGVGFLFGQNIFWSEFCGDSIPSGFEYDWCELWIW